MNPPTRALLIVAFALAASPAAATELPPTFSKKITVELREADVRNVYRLIGDLVATEMRVDACLQQRKLDIKLKNAPISVVLGIMAAKLDVVHTPQPGGKAVVVTCKGDASVGKSPVLDKRISLDVKDASLERVAALLADAAGAKLRPMTELDRKVTLSVNNVRLETAMTIVRESLDLEVLDIVDGELVIALPPPTADR